MIAYILLILLSGIFQSQCKEEEECVNRKLRECSNKYKINLQFYPSNIDDLKQYCGAVEQNDECFKNSWNQCISIKSERDLVIDKMNEFSSPHYKDLCNFNSTYSRLFVKYGKCLSQTILEQKKCQNKYRIMIQPRNEVLNAVGYSKNNSRAVNIQKIRQICCWWVEYQSCSVKSVIDRCGEVAAILANEEFYKSYTSSATSKALTYKSCLPQDKTFRYPTCFLDNSVDPNSLGITFDSNELDVEDNSRREEIMEMLVPNNNELNPMNEFTQIEASTSNSVSIKARIISDFIICLIVLCFY